MPASRPANKPVRRTTRKVPQKRSPRPRATPPPQVRPPAGIPWLYLSLALASFLVGVFSGYTVWGREVENAEVPAATEAANPAAGQLDVAALFAQVNPPEGYKLPARYGDLGPRLIESGIIDYEAFAAIYQDGGNPLTEAQVGILQRGSDEPVVITAENAHFMLNFFWAVGLVNKNPILTEGPIVQNSGGQIDRFASTGGWTLGTKPVTELYASLDLIPLTPEQQKRVEEVASAVYRPCCGNATLFPDCNHGMAMLGLLELMAHGNASVDEMFTAAKFVNAYWFPQQALETAVYLELSEDVDFAQADPRLVVGREMFSASGAGRVHAALQSAGLLPGAPGGGGSCAN